MKKRVKGLTALWIAFALLLSAPPVTVMAEEWVRTSRSLYLLRIWKNSFPCLYKTSGTMPLRKTSAKPDLLNGFWLRAVYIPRPDISYLQKKESYVRFDVPFDRQTDYTPAADFMKYVTVPNGYELKEWNIWGAGRISRIISLLPNLPWPDLSKHGK